MACAAHQAQSSRSKTFLSCMLVWYASALTFQQLKPMDKPLLLLPCSYSGPLQAHLETGQIADTMQAQGF